MNNKDAICKSLNTIREMFVARELADTAEKLQCFTEAEIESISQNKAIFTIDAGSKLRVVYDLLPKFRYAEVKKLFETEFDMYILVLKEKNPTGIKAVVDDYGFKVQVFDIKELQFNISKHHYVPRHRLIQSEEEINNILNNKLVINSRSKLPVILRTDPMAKFLNALPGSLIEITRFSPSSGEHLFYRICI